MTEIRIKMCEGCSDLFPIRAHYNDAGFDVKARGTVILDEKGELLYEHDFNPDSEGDSFALNPGKSCLVKTGVFLDMEDGWECQIRPRSGLAAKSGITVLNSPGTIDAGYRGEVMVVLINHGNARFHVKRGGRIAQVVFKKVPDVTVTLVHEIGDTERGSGGCGSTGS